MLVQKVNVVGFRNIHSVAIETDQSVNVFYGENGSGKTSLLESLFFLSRAKSFRTNKRNGLINIEGDYLAVAVSLSQESKQHRLGLDLDKTGKSRLKLNGDILNRLSEGSRLFPVQLITPESFDVFFGSPKARRSFIDFGLFHVEHEYQSLWSNFQKAQKQINVLLRANKGDKKELMFWYRGLIEAARKVETYRTRFVTDLLQVELSGLVDSLSKDSRTSLLESLTLSYRTKVFDGDIESDADILRQIDKDLRYKQVGFGPSKADLLFVQNGTDMTSMLSRGQSKMMFYLLEVAIVKLVKRVANKNMLLLVDDLPSEVDEVTRDTMLRLLMQSGAQIFVTGIERKIAKEFMKHTNSVNVFHVEHGTIKPENMEQLCP